MKKSLALVGMACSLLLASTANASLVTTWSATETDSWINTTGNLGAVGTGGLTSSESVISWGGTGSYLDKTLSTTLARSAVTITNAAPELEVVTNGGPVFTTVLTHYNNTIKSGQNKLAHTTLHTSLVLTPTAPVGPARAPSVIDFGVNFIETSNIGPADGSGCGFESATSCDDIFVLDNLEGLISSFVYDGYKYTLNAFGFGLTILTDAQCAAVGKPTGCAGVVTPEKEFTRVQMGFTITSEKIPEPAPLALLGLGLFALFSARSRKNS